MTTKQRLFSVLCLVILFSTAALSFALEKPETELKDVKIDTKLGTQIDLSLPFTDSFGENKPLGQFLDSSKPFILVPAYYECPRLCGLVLDGVTRLINALPLKLASEFQVLVVSFDSTETPALATKRRDTFVSRLVDTKTQDFDLARSRWKFLVGPETSVKPLMNQIGFHFTKDHGEFAHGAAIMILTPGGKISQYFTGIEYPPFDVRMSLIEASQGGVGSMVDHVFLFCFRFDQTKGKYVWAAFNVMRTGGALTLLCLGSLVFFLRKKERSNRAV